LEDAVKVYKADTYKNLLNDITCARSNAEAALLPAVGGVAVLLADAIVSLRRAEHIVSALALDEETGRLLQEDEPRL
jgi:hypothetical protein